MVAYPVVVYKDEDSDYGMVVPDLPGCVSAGPSLSIAMEMTHEAVQCHLEGMAKDGDPFPAPSELDDVVEDEEYAHAKAFAAVEIDLDRLSAESERINITLPKWLISAIDSAEPNRSRFLAKCAIEGLQHANKRKAG